MTRSHPIFLLLIFPVILFSQNENGKIKEDSLPSHELAIQIPYGEIQRVNSPLTLHQLTSEHFSEGAITSPLEVLMGKIPGVEVFPSPEPGGVASLRIRGGSPLSTFNQPLIVLDGFPVDPVWLAGSRNYLSLLNPDDIASITILKDAAALALYGYRAQSGAILITTHQAEASPSFRLSYHGGYAQKEIRQQIPVVSAAEFRQVIGKYYGVTHPAWSLLGESQTDWQEEIFQTGSWQNHHLRFSGGIKKLPYTIGLGFTDEMSVLKRDNGQRMTTDIKIAPSFLEDKLKFNVGLKTLHEKNSLAEKGAMNAALSFDPTQPVYAPTDDWGGYFTYLNLIGDPSPLYPANPLALLEQTDYLANSQEILFQVGADCALDFLPGLHLQLRTAMDKKQTQGNVLVTNEAAFITQGQGYRSNYQLENLNQLLEIFLSYQREWKNLSLDAVGGVSGQKTSYFSHEKVSAYDTTRSRRVYTSGSEEIYKGFWSRAQFSWKDRFLLNLGIRAEEPFYYGTSQGLFPAISAGYHLLKTGDSRSGNLKLRGSIGSSGHANSFFITEGFITGEIHRSANIGLDFSLLQERLWGSVSLFRQRIFSAQNLTYIGGSINIVPFGDMLAKGTEWDFHASAIQTKNLDLELGLNASFIQNEITALSYFFSSLPDGIRLSYLPNSLGIPVQLHTPDYPAYSFSLFEQTYDSRGLPLEGEFTDQNEDGVIDQEDKFIIAASPIRRMSFHGRLRYRHFELSWLSSARWGHQVYRNDIAMGVPINNAYQEQGYLVNLHADYYKYKFRNSQVGSDIFLQDAAFLRLDNIRLAYQIKKTAKLPFGMQLAIIAQNPVIISAFDGLNPDIQDGLNYNLYPFSKNWVIDISLNL